MARVNRPKPPNSYLIAQTESLTKLNQEQPESSTISYDFKPVNEGLNQMLRATFAKKRGAITRFILTSRIKLKDEKLSLEEHHEKVRTDN